MGSSISLRVMLSARLMIGVETVANQLPDLTILSQELIFVNRR